MGRHLAIDVDAWQADLVSLSAHKLGGPKGVGALFVRRGTQLLPQLQGGSQERQRRAGTEDVPAIVGFGAAFRIVHGDAHRARGGDARGSSTSRGGCARRSSTFRGWPGPATNAARLPGMEAWPTPMDIQGGDLVAALDLEGVDNFDGSACTSGSAEPSHVLLAMGVEPHWRMAVPDDDRPRPARSAPRSVGGRDLALHRLGRLRGSLPSAVVSA